MRIVIALILTSIVSCTAKASDRAAWLCQLDSPNKTQLLVQSERESGDAEAASWQVYVNGARLDAICEDDDGLVNCSYGTHEEWAQHRDWSLGMNPAARDVWVRNNDLNAHLTYLGRNTPDWLAVEEMRKRVVWGRCAPVEHRVMLPASTEMIPF